MESIAQRVGDFVDARRGEIEDLLLALVCESSATPPGDERKVCAVIREQASRWGLPEPEVWADKPERPNLIYTIRGKAGGRVLVLNGHVDTKPIGNAAEWKLIDPRTPRVIDGKLYGRGSADMKGAVAAMLAGAWALTQCGVVFPGTLQLAFTADEEGGSSFGAKVLVRRGLRADAILVGEPSGTDANFDAIGLACRGAMLAKIVVRGTQMHSSLSDRGGCVNASVKMAEVMVEFSRSLKGRLHFKPHPLYPLGPTVNPGVILEGGVFYGVVPGIAAFGFDLRVIPSMECTQVQADIRGFLEDLMNRDPDLKAELALEKPPIPSWVPPAEIDRANPLVGACTASAREVLGREPEPIGMPFATDGCFYAGELGIPTIPAFGPGFIRLAHAADEYVDLQAVWDAAKIYALSAARYLEGASAS